MAMSQQKRLLLTLAGVVVAAGSLGAYAFFGVFRTEQAEDARKDAEAKLFGLDPKDVQRLEISSLAKGDTTLERKDGVWRVVKPVDAKADGAEVDSLLERLAAAKRRKLIHEKSADLKPFGLDIPVVWAIASTASSESARLAVGADNDFDRSLFVSTGEGLVATAEPALKTDLDKSTFDLRDKAVIVFGDDGLEALTATGSASWSLERHDGRWRIGGEDADEKETGHILRALHDLRATDFPAGDPAPFGLDAPELTVELRRAGAEPLTLRFGAAGGKHYARLDDGPVAEVAEKILDDLRKSPAELRDRRVVPFDEAKVAALEFGSADETLRVERREEDGAKAWKVVAPKEAAAKQWKVSSALSTLKELRFDADSGAPGPDSGLDAPARTVKVLDEGGGALATLLVGSDADGKTWVKSAETGRAGTVDTSRIGLLPKALSEVEDSPPAPAAAQAD